MAGKYLVLDFESGEYLVPDPDEPEFEVPPEEPVGPVAPSTRLPSGRAAVEEASNIVERICDLLLEMPKDDVGRVGSDLRAACNFVRAFSEQMLAFGSEQFFPRLAECFDLARDAGATLANFENARLKLLEEKPLSLMAFAVKQAGIRSCLEMEALEIADIVFVSRDDVEKVQKQMRMAFAEAIESAADDMEQEVYQALNALAAAVQFYLYDTSRPLPRMVRFQFARSAPTLVYAYRLYQNAARGDELLMENKTVHPAFARRAGRALSA